MLVSGANFCQKLWGGAVGEVGKGVGTGQVPSGPPPSHRDQALIGLLDPTIGADVRGFVEGLLPPKPASPAPATPTHAQIVVRLHKLYDSETQLVRKVDEVEGRFEKARAIESANEADCCERTRKGGTDSDGMEDAVTVEEDGTSEEVGTEMEKGKRRKVLWRGRFSRRGGTVQEFPAGCASVSFPACCSDLTSVLPGPGSEIRKQLGWIQMEKTDRSGVWFFRGAFQGEDLFSSLAVSGDWVKKGSYHTAWSVPGDSSCSCSYAFRHGTAIGPHTGKRCWVLLSWLWRTIAPLMKPWCAEGEVPTAANLNLYRGGTSRVNWHSDNEPLFGGSGVHKLIVSVSFGAPVLFKWRCRSCLDSGERSCWLGHGDILVMDGQCQDEFLHCTSPGLEHERINVTYRWIRQHTHFCPLFRAGVVCCLPTCAKGSSVHVTGNLGVSCFWTSGFFFVLCACWRFWV